MPTSAKENKDIVQAWFRDINPQTVVDIGPGEATYYDLLADYNGAHWTGIEAWGPYVNQYNLNDKYHKIIVADVNYVKEDVFNVDLVIAGDILEHIKKGECKKLINSILTMSKYFIISIPVLHLDQGAYEGNWFEEHVGHWHYEEMISYLESIDAKVIDSIEGDILAYFLVKR